MHMTGSVRNKFHFATVDEWENAKLSEPPKISLLLVSLTTICRVRTLPAVRTILLSLRWQTPPIRKSN
jgi:hypothetical protein